MKRFIKHLILLSAISLSPAIYAQTYHQDFSDEKFVLDTIGRGNTGIHDGKLVSRRSYACFGQNDWKDYRIEFRARTPESEDQVQIWSGFRAFNRNDRYLVGLKGGLQDDICLMRMGYMGTDEFLSIKGLDFHPVPGQWYDFRIEVCGNRIRVFLNHEKLPRIDCTDDNYTLAPSGKVTLGGAWIPAEFDDLQIAPLEEGALDGVPAEEYSDALSAEQKELKRRKERSSYSAVEVSCLNDTRTEIPLDGKWLFKPDYEISSDDNAVSPQWDDTDWHVMEVPSFWKPIRIWLHGEKMARGLSKGVSDTYFQKETKRCENYTFDYEKTKSAYYRQWIELPDDLAGKQIAIHFDAVSLVSEVYMNGKHAGGNVGMFGDFTCDVTDLVRPGRNLLAVYVSNNYVKDIDDEDKIVDVAVSVEVTNRMIKDLPHGFFKDSPAGIWQPVRLIVTEPVTIEDVFIQPGLHSVKYDVTLKNRTSKKRVCHLQSSIVSKEDASELSPMECLGKIVLKKGEEKVVSFEVGDLEPLLWEPGKPHLYDFLFQLTSGKNLLDSRKYVSGFRTFESRNGFFYLNGRPYWLRGGNQTAAQLYPNDQSAADKFHTLMKEGNTVVTRTHTAPYNELWMTSADEIGIGVSFEGTWPWLMIQSSMPDRKVIEIWKEEYLRMLRKYRNHPSLLFWTVNNEMKFHHNEPDVEKAEMKMKIISEVVGEMRKIDPTRLVCFDSGYQRNKALKRFGQEFMDTVDDGDMDDIHAYYNWYNHSLFNQFRGEFQQSAKTPGRPLISQEMSTGYPNSETGHATTFYNITHQNPQTLVGYDAYAFGDPACFLKVHSFITQELAEALRRSNPEATGILHFSLVTWYQNIADIEHLGTYDTYHAMKRALQPVLLSAELWGRNFYCGDHFPVRFCIVNDDEEGKSVPASEIHWSFEDQEGTVLSEGSIPCPEVAYWERKWLEPEIEVPSFEKARKEALCFKIRLEHSGKVLSANQYELNVADREWTSASSCTLPLDLLDAGDGKEMENVLRGLGIHFDVPASLEESLESVEKPLFVNAAGKLTPENVRRFRKAVAAGKKVILQASDETARQLFPEYVTGSIRLSEGEIVSMEKEESPVFDGLVNMDLRNFNNGKSGMPQACRSALQINREDAVEEIASHMKVHGYVNGNMEERSQYVRSIKGYPVIRIHDGAGWVIVSTMCLDKALSDPIAGKLLVNLLNELK